VQNNNNNQGPQDQQQQAPPPPPPPPAGMEQFLAAQTQLLTNMAQTMANMQAQMNQAHRRSRGTVIVTS